MQTLDKDALGIELTLAGPGANWHLSKESRLKHLYILGSTGCGKTNLLTQLVERDINRRRSVVVLDMRGDLIDAITRFAASGVASERLHLIDLRRPELSFGLNPFQYGNDAYSSALQVHAILRASAESWGVQLDETLRCSLIVLANARRSLTELPRLLTDHAFRDRLLGGVEDDYVKSFFDRFDRLSQDKQSQWVLPVLNKVSPFVSHPAIRAILNERSPVDLPEVLDCPGSILLVALGADRLHGLAGTFGCLAVSAIENSVMKRVDQAEPKRNPVHLYLDEFENFQTPAFEAIIAEGRRFRLGLTLSHQNLHQLDSRLRHVIMNNAGTRIYFRTGLTDASELGRELLNYGIKDPVKSLLRLPTGQAFVVGEGVQGRLVSFRKANVAEPDQDALDALYKNICHRSGQRIATSSKAEAKKPKVQHIKKPRAGRRKQDAS